MRSGLELNELIKNIESKRKGNQSKDHQDILNVSEVQNQSSSFSMNNYQRSLTKNEDLEEIGIKSHNNLRLSEIPEQNESYISQNKSMIQKMENGRDKIP